MEPKIRPINNKPAAKKKNKNKKQQQQLALPSPQYLAMLKQVNTLANKVNSIKKDWNHKRVPGLFEKVNSYHDNMLAEYVYGLYHPDVVYRQNLIIKSPNVVPIPTATFSFKETYFTKPNASGNIAICWNPNFLGSSGEIVKAVDPNLAGYYGYFSTLYINNDPTLTGNAPNGEWKAVTFRHVQQDFSKYRLTSACLKIKYTGKVLNQSGMFAACASFMEFPRTVLTTLSTVATPDTYPLTDQNYPQLNALGDFDTIRQGQWARTVSIVNEPDGITVVWLPVDALSSVFIDNADTIDPKPDRKSYHDGFTITDWVARNAGMTYDLCGYGIAQDNGSDTNTIAIECYYNYEILVREVQMPYFRPTTLEPTLSRRIESMAGAVKEITNSATAITTTKMHDDPSVMSKIQGAIRQGLNMVDHYMPLIKIASLLV